MSVKGRVTSIGAVVAVIATVAVPALASGGKASKVGARVKASNYEFTADSVKIKKGQKVVWKFVEGKHDVKGKGFHSKPQRSGKFAHVFDKVGTYKYVCTFHAPDMKGVVKVVK
jgi:plastocyanin